MRYAIRSYLILPLFIIGFVCFCDVDFLLGTIRDDSLNSGSKNHVEAHIKLSQTEIR